MSNQIVKQKTMVRLRIAPSPTGYPHIGTMYQALFNFAYARKHSGKFIVRIEDTDRSRFVEGAEDVIFSSLDWFGLTEDESPRFDGEFGPYKQSERLETYHKYVQDLIDKGKAKIEHLNKEGAGIKKDYTHKPSMQVRAEDHPSQAEPTSVAEMPMNGEYIVRMIVPKDTAITFRDEIRGDITFESNQVNAQVLLKSDKFPTYHLAVVVDDHLMGITHIVRGEEWISSTPKHVLLYQYLGWELPKFYHTPDLRNPDKSKLSKRHGHTNVNWYKEEGYLPEAILNYLALLGWSHTDEKEIFSLEEFIQEFDLKDISPVGPVFDLVKLTWMNQQYIQKLSDAELLEKLMSFDPSLKEKDQELLEKIMPLVKTRITTLKEFSEVTAFFFFQESVSLTIDEMKIGKEVLTGLKAITDWNDENIFATLKRVMNENKIRMPIFYKIFTGKERGLPLPQSIALLEKDIVLKKLEKNLTSV